LQLESVAKQSHKQTSKQAQHYALLRQQLCQDKHLPSCKTQTVGLLRPCDDVVATTLKQANLASLPLLARMVSSLDAFARIRIATINFVMSVRPSVRMEKLGSHWTDFH